MSPDDRFDTLIEATLHAHRHLDAEGLPVPPAAWWDLTPEQCEQAFELRLRARAIERALHERGWSSTVQAVMERIGGLA
jgi:hypothetical protein